MDLRSRLSAALSEDLGPGDVTTEATIGAQVNGSAVIVAKQALVVSGQRFAKAAFEVASARLGTFVSYQPKVADGEMVEPGTVIAEAHGNLRAILVGERLALNLMMRACGIATHVRDVLAFVGPKTFRAVDTRKATPLWRDLEKEAVRNGGGANHRFGLFDGVLIKENHIAGAGGVEIAIERARAAVHHLLKIEVEVTTLEELETALNAGADAVLLDNMTDEQLQQAIAIVEKVKPGTMVEASGNMNAERMKRIAAFGLDVVSVGGFIHQARWADLSLRVKP